MKKLTHFIRGEQVAPRHQKYLDNYDPAIGTIYTLTPDGSEDDVQAAVEAASDAFSQWASRSVEERAHILMKLADLLAQNLDTLAKAESIDNGKPIALARKVDIPRAIQNFRFFASAIQHFATEAHPMGKSTLNYTLRQPLGVVGCISPWNLPLYLLTWKIAPALAAGNCVVAKPSEVTPMTAYLLGQISRVAGLPPGVFNIIHGQGTEVGMALVKHPKVKAVSFTGSTRAGAEIAQAVAPSFKKLSLEMGGKNPILIFADCHYEEMLETTLRSAFSNQGQICLSGSRILVERPLYKRFCKDFTTRAKALRVGDPLQENTQQGAVVSENHMNKILSYIEMAKEAGAKIRCGGNQVHLAGRCQKGWFVAPTVIEGLPQNSRLNQEEIFGPVVTLKPFDTEAQALQYANDVEYGLATSIWTQNIDRAHRLAQAIEAGVVWINCWMLRDLRTPFGGVKNSGLGREGGWEILRFFTEPKNVCLKF